MEKIFHNNLLRELETSMGSEAYTLQTKGKETMCGVWQRDISDFMSSFLPSSTFIGVTRAITCKVRSIYKKFIVFIKFAEHIISSLKFSIV